MSFVGFHARTWNRSYQEAVTGDTFSEKEGFVLYIFRFGESF